MAILDLIKNYGNRQVVIEKDKAIIELAENGGSGSEYLTCSNSKIDITKFIGDSADRIIESILMYCSYDDNGTQVTYLGNFAFFPQTCYVSISKGYIEANVSEGKIPLFTKDFVENGAEGAEVIHSNIEIPEGFYYDAHYKVEKSVSDYGEMKIKLTLIGQCTTR